MSKDIKILMGISFIMGALVASILFVSYIDGQLIQHAVSFAFVLCLMIIWYILSLCFNILKVLFWAIVNKIKGIEADESIEIIKTKFNNEVEK